MRTSAASLHTAILGSLLMALTACGGGGGGSSSSAAKGGDGSSGANAAPTISGQPGSSVQAGQNYAFQPSAQDPEGAALQYSVANLPSWATFNATNGRISGSPTAADIGTYSNLTITVSDGQLTAQLGPFAINVVDVGAGVGAATLSWTPPASNTDGTTLSNLAGYQVMYGRSPSNLSQTVVVNNASISTYVVDSLSSGEWYFAVVAVNSQGATSQPSNVAAKTIS